MKFSLGGKQSIEFKTDLEGLEKFAPVKPAKFFLPNWFKDMNEYITQDAIHEKGKGVVGTYLYEIAEQKGIETTVLARDEGYPLQVKVQRHG